MNKFLFTLLLASCSLYAQASSPVQIDVESGLSNNYILSMVLDGNGYVWAGTEAGLNRIAGHTVSVFRREQMGTANDKILSLFYDRHSNRMLIGTEQCLVVYDCTKGVFGHRFRGDELVNYSLVDIADDHRQGVWLIFGNGKVQHLDCATNTLSTLHTELPGSRCGMDDGQGHLYIGHSKEGMSIVDYKKQTVIRHFVKTNGALPSNNVRRIVKDSKGQIWIGTDQGLALFSAATESFNLNTIGTEATRANVYDICEILSDGGSLYGGLADSHLWIATDVGGVLTDERQTSLCGTSATARLVETSSLNTRCILQDAYRNIWIGNHSTGVDFIPSQEPLFRTLDFSAVKATDQFSPTTPQAWAGTTASGQTKTKRVYGITNDRQGRIWVSGEDDLSVFSYDGITTDKLKIEGRWRVSGMKHRAHSFARCLMADSQGYIWLGMEDEGVIRFDTRRQQFEPIDIGYGVCDIHSFLEDTDGRIWIGAEYGVCIYDKGHVSHQDAFTRITDEAPVTCFIRLSPTQLLLTTQGSGIVIINTGTMAAQHLTMADGLPSNNINHALTDRTSGLWLATSEGLIRMPDMRDLRRFVVYDGKAGLPDRQVRAIKQDAQGRIWASTYTGIVCLDTVARRFYNYSQHNPNTSGFMEGAVATLSDGSIAFGSSKGVFYFQPEAIGNTHEVSPVRIVRCEVFSPTEKEERRQGDERSSRLGTSQYIQPDANGRIIVSYQQNTLRIAYAVQNFAQVDDVEYSYMMKGLSDKWYPGGKDNEVTFRSLRPGNYTFLLRAKLKSQDWEKAITTQLSIRVTPPFWQTWWAWMFYILLATTAVWYFFRAYKRHLALQNSLEMTRHESMQKQELNEERLRFFTNITHELRTPLTLILGPLEDLAADDTLKAGSRRKVKIINRNAGRLRDLINQILEFRKTETQNRRLTVARGDIGQFVREIVLNYKELNRNQQVDIRYHQNNSVPMAYFDSEVVATILNNLLSNAIKYTEQGCIDVTIETTGNEQILLHVADTGYGISAEALPHIFDRYYQAKGSHQASGTGIGLSLVKSLADLHEAQLTVQSEEGKGCVFTVALSAVNNYPNALHKEDVRRVKEVKRADIESDEPADDEEQAPLLLIVEDNEDIRQYIVDSLYDDFRILQAKNGMEGEALATQHLPDLIVSDIMMPQMNGVELTRRLKDSIQTSHIPIILLTAKDTDEDKEEGYNSGADSYLTKPFTAKLLTSRIRNLLANRRRLAEQLSNNGVESIPTSRTASTDALSRLDREFMERLNHTIEEHIMQTDIDMAFLTDKMAMSHSTFYRKVKALTGLTAKEYVRKQRLSHCYQLLESGDYNVSEAAMMTGFNQMAHFREVFKREFGILPSELTKKSSNTATTERR